MPEMKTGIELIAEDKWNAPEFDSTVMMLKHIQRESANIPLCPEVFTVELLAKMGSVIVKEIDRLQREGE